MGSKININCTSKTIVTLAGALSNYLTTVKMYLTIAALIFYKNDHYII